MSEENKALVHRFVEECINRANPDAADELFAPDFVGHYPGLPEVSSAEAWKQLAPAYFSAFPDLRETIEDMIAEGDKVAYRGTSRGTHRGEFHGIAPTGKPVTIAEMHIVRVVDGKQVEHWAEYDTLGMLRQLGAIPEPQPASG